MSEDPVIVEIHKTRENIWKSCHEDREEYKKMITDADAKLKKAGMRFISKEEVKQKRVHSLEHAD